MRIKTLKKFTGFLRGPLCLCAFVVQIVATGQVREKISLNSGWNFEIGQQSSRVNLPHTWNAADILDETPGYHQGQGFYSRSVFIGEAYRDWNVSLYFEGVCNKATVFINGQKAGVHNGGFTGFSVQASRYLKFNDSNLIRVEVDNSKHLSDSIPPFSGDFNLMGGIYRDVWLVITNPVHFEGPSGSQGILFSTPYVDDKSASFNIRVSIKGKKDGHTFYIGYEIVKDGKILKNDKASVPGNQDLNFSFNESIREPILWTPENPALYQLRMFIRNEQDQLLDEVEMNVGFRWFGISSKKEFLLNGKPYKLKGASRHQDYDRIGYALTDAHHINDMRLMKEMGCNFIRIAHYPQDPAIYEACDKLGLISWSEIPVVDKVVNSEAFHRNCESMMTEMVLQNYNHPSVAMWGYHNEVRNLDTATISNARRLDKITRQLDPQRFTAMAFESNFDNGYFENPLLKDIMAIPDIVGYNVYEGWYRGTIPTVPQFINRLYNIYPTKPMILSEYGAGSSTNIHNRQPTIFDFSEEYQCLFQEPYLDEGEKHPWMIGWAIWNFIDFQRDGREDVQPNINNKGMVTTDRKPKDAYYYYKARWSREPFVYIAGKNWTERFFFTTGEREKIVVYSNQPKLILLQNGKPVPLASSKNGKFIFTVIAKEGMNQLVCKTPDGVLTDLLLIEYHFILESAFSKKFPGTEISFNTGQSRSFYKDHSNINWLPDKAYRPGTWGYVNGKIYSSWPGNASWEGLREGVHKPVSLTADEPVFQTFVEELSAWKADVPDGKYRITLYLCEPLNGAQRKNESRIMDIQLNGQQWINGLNMEMHYGILTAIQFHKEITVKNGKGISVDFKALSGKTILNGIRIQKL